MFSWILLAALIGVVLWLIGAYNGLISLKNQTGNAFKQIDVQLKRRHDLIPNLVNAVKGAMDFERSTLEAVIQARNQAVKVNATGPEGIKQISQAENALSSALQRLMVVVEMYPDLKSDQNFRDLQAQLEGTENRITVARNRYIGSVQEYNVTVRSFPSNLTAMMFGYQAKANFTVENEAQISKPPQVDFTRPKQ